MPGYGTVCGANEVKSRVEKIFLGWGVKIWGSGGTMEHRQPNKMGSLLLKSIVSQLELYIRSVEEHNMQDITGVLVELDNVAATRFAGGDNAQLSNKVVVTLVNIGEESTLKNQPNSKYRDGQYLSMLPVVHVNLYLLFAANFENNYETAIRYIFRVMEFFQGRKIFKIKNAPIAGDASERPNDMELTAELHTLSFEQINDLWGSLGGRQMPFVMYRLRLVPVQMEQVLGREGIITEINLNIASPV